MEIFLTGASGFIGGAIAQDLKNKHRIKAMSRLARSDAALTAMGVQTIRADLDTITPAMLEGTEAVIHCAAFVGPWGSRADFWNGTVEGTRHLLDAARAAGVKRFIHMGTEAVLFAGQDMIDIDEDYPYPPSTPYLYSETKREAEKLVLQANSPGFETIVLRPRLVWGAGDTSVLPVIKRLIKEGKFMWLDGGRARTSTTCITNLVHAVDLSLSKGKGGRIYFVTDEEISTFHEFLTAMLRTQNMEIPEKSIPAWIASFLARIVEGAWRLFRIGSEPPLMRFPTDITARQCTIKIDRAKKELGYRPIVTVAQGLAAMKPMP